MLLIDDVSKAYPDGHLALDGVRLAVPDGQFACLIGPSGCGKSTLLRCVAGLSPPTTGRVLLDGAEVTAPPRDLAVVLQDYARSLFPWLTVAANVDLALRYTGIPRAARRERVAEALAAVGLAGRARAHPWQLSGGMQQRVAIARAVVSRPRLLVMDEPFAAVDAQTREELEDLVRRLWRELAMTVLFVTHDIDEAIYLGERVVVLAAPPRSVAADVDVDLGAGRDQLATRAHPRFSELRARLHGELAAARAAAAAPTTRHSTITRGDP